MTFTSVAREARRGASSVVRNSVAVGMRSTGRLHIMIGRTLGAEMGVVNGEPVEIQLGEGDDAGKVRLLLGHPGFRIGPTRASDEKCRAQNEPLVSYWLSVFAWAGLPTEPRPAVIVRHRVLADRVIEIDMPAWARPAAPRPFTSIDRAGSRPAAAVRS